VRLSLSIKFGLAAALLVVLIAGVTSYLMVFRFAQASLDELVSRDKELATVLAGLRGADGRLDFTTLRTFVERSDKVDIGLVYVMEVEEGGRIHQGALNPRLFSAMDPDFEVAVREGRARVLEKLAAGTLDLKDKVMLYSYQLRVGTKLRLGFDFQRIERQVAAQQKMGLVILGAGLLVGIVLAVVLSRRLARPVRRLAGAMEAVARGEVNQTVQVTSSDELASLAASFNQMTRALREMARVRELASVYLSPPVVDRLLREANPLEMVAEERAVTVLSAAFDDFGPLARQLSPRETIRLLNEYLAPIIDAVLAEDGLVEEIEGERLVAVWGAPADVVEPELHAIRAALAAQDAVEAEARRQAAAGGLALSLKIGICSGRAVAGNLGSAHRVVYRVLGVAVQIARQVESMAAASEVVVSEATYSKVRQHVNASACAPLMLEDLEEAVPLYRVARGPRTTGGFTGAVRRSS
jgi:class 3 adenylate cyclase